MQLCRKETFFEAEQEELKHRIQSYTGLHMSKKNRINNAQLVIKELTLKWEEELQKGLKEKDEALMQLQAEHLQLRPRMDELETFLKTARAPCKAGSKSTRKDGKRTSANRATSPSSGRPTSRRRLWTRARRSTASPSPCRTSNATSAPSTTIRRNATRA